MTNSVKYSREAMDDLRDGRGPRGEGKWGQRHTETFEKSGRELEVSERRSRKDVGEEAERGASAMLLSQMGLS